ncbi:MAG TPA: non-canonical purine NTP pyrophosphatase [Candidatus Saccharimonadales bacterium]|jgi:XTP/dITP diphosphohydrolase
MSTLFFATGNAEKFEIAQAACGPLGVTLEQAKLDISEIQGEDSEVIIRDKIQKAFDLLKRPVIVSDDSWSIPGLRGFPGPYMKSIDHWFTPQDILNLTRPLQDRRIILIQLLAFQDERGQKVFRKEHEGALLTEARGAYGNPFQKILAMPGDDGLSVAEAYDLGAVRAERDVAAGWQAFAAWYNEPTRG